MFHQISENQRRDEFLDILFTFLISLANWVQMLIYIKSSFFF